MTYEPPTILIESDPWKSIDESIRLLINKVILELNPETLDDDLIDLVEDFTERVEAIDYLIDKLQKLKREYE